MFLFDMIMKPADSYWKKQFNAERIRRQRAEADAKCYKDEADYTNASLGMLSERDLKQARALDVCAKEIERLKGRLAMAEAQIAQKDTEIGLLHEALKSERNLSAALKTNSRLWEGMKARAEGRESENETDTRSDRPAF